MNSVGWNRCQIDKFYFVQLLLLVKCLPFCFIMIVIWRTQPGFTGGNLYSRFTAYLELRKITLFHQWRWVFIISFWKFSVYAISPSSGWASFSKRVSNCQSTELWRPIITSSRCLCFFIELDQCKTTLTEECSWVREKTFVWLSYPVKMLFI